MNFYLIVAADENLGIGKNGKIPWRLPSDVKFFQHTTIGNGKNAVIMGRTTWESLPEKHRPLKNRLNIVMTRDSDYALTPGVILANSLESALLAAKKNGVEKTFVIGGAQVYAQSITHPRCAGIYLTEILEKFDCDAFFPKIPDGFKLKSESEILEENDVKFKFAFYVRK